MREWAKPTGAKRRTRLVSCAAAVAVGVLLAGCAAHQAPRATVPTSTASSAPSPQASAPPSAPSLKPALAASENLAYFDTVAAGVLAGDPAAGGRAFIDALTTAGFDKSEMEVTFDRTAADLDADSIQFAVRFNGECLVGQTFPTGAYHSAVTPLLGTGTCLVGATRQIDW